MGENPFTKSSDSSDGNGTSGSTESPFAGKFSFSFATFNTVPQEKSFLSFSQDKEKAATGGSADPEKPSPFSFAFPTDAPSSVGSFSSELPASAPEADVPQVEPMAAYTGEEDEEKIFAGNVKVFQLTENVSEESTQREKTWKERGKGDLRVNVRKDDANKSRVIVRTEKTRKLILNMPLYRNTTCDKPSDTAVRLCGFNNVDGDIKFQSFLIKQRTREETESLYKLVSEKIEKGDSFTITVADAPSVSKEQDSEKPAQETKQADEEPKKEEEAKKEEEQVYG